MMCLLSSTFLSSASSSSSNSGYKDSDPVAATTATTAPPASAQSPPSEDDFKDDDDMVNSSGDVGGGVGEDEETASGKPLSDVQMPPTPPVTQGDCQDFHPEKQPLEKPAAEAFAKAAAVKADAKAAVCEDSPLKGYRRVLARNSGRWVLQFVSPEGLRFESQDELASHVCRKRPDMGMDDWKKLDLHFLRHSTEGDQRPPMTSSEEEDYDDVTTIIQRVPFTFCSMRQNIFDLKRRKRGGGWKHQRGGGGKDFCRRNSIAAIPLSARQPPLPPAPSLPTRTEVSATAFPAISNTSSSPDEKMECQTGFEEEEAKEKVKLHSETPTTPIQTDQVQIPQPPEKPHESQQTQQISPQQKQQDEPLPKAEPPNPLEKPLEPAEQPLKPAEQPLKPAEQPLKPAEQPLKPPEQPLKPAKQPLKPADQPLTPEKQTLEKSQHLPQKPSENQPPEKSQDRVQDLPQAPTLELPQNGKPPRDVLPSPPPPQLSPPVALCVKPNEDVKSNDSHSSAKKNCLPKVISCDETLIAKTTTINNCQQKQQQKVHKQEQKEQLNVSVFEEESQEEEEEEVALLLEDDEEEEEEEHEQAPKSRVQKGADERALLNRRPHSSATVATTVREDYPARPHSSAIEEIGSFSTPPPHRPCSSATSTRSSLSSRCEVLPLLNEDEEVVMVSSCGNADPEPQEESRLSRAASSTSHDGPMSHSSIDCVISVSDVFERTPLSSFRCVNCQREYCGKSDAISFDLERQTMHVICHSCLWWTSRKINTRLKNN